jgi:acyl dehydratase
MSAVLYFEDIDTPGTTRGPSAIVDKTEMPEFARTWDPVPFHVDEAAGNAAFGSLTAPGVFVLAFKQRLIHRLDVFPALIASLGYDEVRFLEPVRPGDELTLVIDWVEKRLSKSRNDRGVLVQRFSLVNQKDEVAMSHLDTILVRTRPDPK